MSRQLPITIARHPASGETPNFYQSPLFFVHKDLTISNIKIGAEMLSNRSVYEFLKRVRRIWENFRNLHAFVESFRGFRKL